MIILGVWFRCYAARLSTSAQQFARNCDTVHNCNVQGTMQGSMVVDVVPAVVSAK